MTTAYDKFYIDGSWVKLQGRKTLEVINPATEAPFATITLGTAEDVDAAAKAARKAFPAWSASTVEQRVAVIEKIIAGMKARSAELATAISNEMGAPMSLASTAQVGAGMAHFFNILPILKNYPFEEMRGTSAIVKEPVGVCGFITPWNWPLNQIACKVAPAIAAGCTMVLKPSEIAPVSAYLLAEIIAESGLPAGVFNLVNGDGPTVGAAIAAHPEMDLVSFTGPAARWARPPPIPSRRCAWSWGARAPISSWTTPPTLPRRSAAAPLPASTTAGNPAMPPPACWCPAPAWPKPSRRRRRLPPR